MKTYTSLITLTITIQILITITIMITLITLTNNNENIYKTTIITLKICTSLYPHIGVSKALTIKSEM